MISLYGGNQGGTANIFSSLSRKPASGFFYFTYLFMDFVNHFYEKEDKL